MSQEPDMVASYMRKRLDADLDSYLLDAWLGFVDSMIREGKVSPDLRAVREKIATRLAEQKLIEAGGGDAD